MKETCVWAVVILGVLVAASDFSLTHGQAILAPDASVAGISADKPDKPDKPEKPEKPEPPRRAPEAATLILTGLGAAAVLGWARWKKGPKAG